jgi:hypothetical protein
VLQHVGRVTAGEDRIEEEPVGVPVRPPCRGHVILMVRSVAYRRQIQRDAHLGRWDGRANCLYRFAVRQQKMMGRRDGLPNVADPWSVVTGSVAQPGGAPRLVERDPPADRPAQRPGNGPGVLGEAAHGVALRPPALVLKGLRQIPVVEREDRKDAPGAKTVHDPAVEVEALGVGRAFARWLDTRPGHREAVCADAKLRQEVEILFPSQEMIARDVAGVAIDRLAGGVAERVPDGHAPASDVYGPFDLVRRGGRAEQKTLGERDGIAVES